LSEFVVVLARDLTSCQGFVRKLKNLKKLKNDKTEISENLVIPRVFEVFEFLENLIFEFFEIFEIYNYNLSYNSYIIRITNLKTLDKPRKYWYYY